MPSKLWYFSRLFEYMHLKWLNILEKNAAISRQYFTKVAKYCNSVSLNFRQYKDKFVPEEKPLRRWHVQHEDWKSSSDHQWFEIRRFTNPFHAQDTSWYSSSWLSKISSFRQETSHLYYRNDPVKYNLNMIRHQSFDLAERKLQKTR